MLSCTRAFLLIMKALIYVCIYIYTVEGLPDLLALSPEDVLLRWFNHQLRAAGSSRKVRNFGTDVMESESYVVLLNQIAPKTSGVDMSPLRVSITVCMSVRACMHACVRVCVCVCVCV